MSKLSKLASQPGRFFIDTFKNLVQPKKGKVYVFGINGWKQHLRSCLPDSELVFFDASMREEEFSKTHKADLLKEGASILVWELPVPGFLQRFAQENNIPLTYAADGFIHIAALKVSQSLPRSLCFDQKSPFFNAREATDLEDRLNTLELDPQTLDRARRCISLFLESGLSKFNPLNPAHVPSRKSSEKRILVIGEPPGSGAMTYGVEYPVSNNDLITLALEENPAAEILYWPAPGFPQKQKNSLAPHPGASSLTLLHKNVRLAEVLESVDHVYTIANQAGFEALLRGLPVTTLGCPFYAGWGVTDSRQKTPRRQKTLTVEELFAVAYLEYAKYYDPVTGREISFEETINQLTQELKQMQQRTGSTLGTRESSKDSNGGNQPSAQPRTDDKENGFPGWYNAHHQRNLIPNDGKATFVYLPWIAEHGDALIPHLESDDYHVVALDLFLDIKEGRTRFDIRKFALENPGLYRRMILRRMIPLRGKVAGFLFSFDWLVTIRVVVSVCRELGIPTILIPHESVFVDRDKYYCDLRANVTLPSSDVILAWGELQAGVFKERGYPEDQIRIVGTPKFDLIKPPDLDRSTFCRIFALQPERKIVLFATQPLDSQLDQKMAKACQVEAINGILDYVEQAGWQLLVRMPPSREDVLGPELRARLNRSDCAAIDEANCYVVSPAEALAHCDIVAAVNSTMLFEAVLRGKAAVAVNYTGTPSTWAQAGVPLVKAPSGLNAALDQIGAGWKAPEEGMRWAAKMFSVGEFDNRAGQRLRAYLSEVAGKTTAVPRLGSALERALARKGCAIDKIALPSSVSHLTPAIQSILNAKSVIIANETDNPSEIIAVDLFVAWDATREEAMAAASPWGRELGWETLYLHEGFIGSPAGDKPLSVVLSGASPYYDRKRRSSLISQLESAPQLSPEQKDRASAAICTLVNAQVGRDNRSLPLPLSLGRPGKRKILLVDQSETDPTLEAGLADEAAFRNMLTEALELGEDYDVIIRQGKDGTGHISSSQLGRYPAMTKNLTVIDFDINPHALFKQVDEVWVVTSEIGFEAALAGKKVRCFGAPFYAGWGFTEDVALAPAPVERSVEEVFFWTCIQHSAYIHPRTGKLIDLEEAIRYVAEKSGRKAPKETAKAARKVDAEPVLVGLSE